MQDPDLLQPSSASSKLLFLSCIVDFSDRNSSVHLYNICDSCTVKYLQIMHLHLDVAGLPNGLVNFELHRLWYFQQNAVEEN